MNDVVLPDPNVEAHRVAFKARPWQRPLRVYFKQGGKRASVVAHRRAGKDRVALFIELEQMLARPCEVWHTLPFYSQARKVVWDALTGTGERLIDAAFPRGIVEKRTEDEMTIKLINGSIWRLVGADAFDRLVGSNLCHVTFSEYALTSPKSYEFIRPILAENGGSALFITTPRGHNHAYDLHEFARTNPDWYCATHPVSETRLISQEVLAEERLTMPDELYRQEYECDFSAANVGSILGRVIEQAERDGRVRDGELYDETGGEVHLVADIGFRDAAAWWWVQPCPGGFRVIDYDEGTRMDASEWIARLKGHPYRIDKLWLPHDARAKTFRSQYTVVDVFMRSGLAKSYGLVPNTSIADRINAARMFAGHCEFDRVRCAKGLLSLREWSFQFDEERHTFSSTPLHDQHSHPGDAFSYAAVALRPHVQEAVESADPHVIPEATYSFSLDQLWPDQHGLHHVDHYRIR
jgi:phage terminase large subunit